MAAMDDGSFESRIGKGTKISGKPNFRAPAKIEGEAEGEITGDVIMIAQGAVVTARIAGTRVTVAGQVSGEIIARERLELLPTARLKCTITTPSLILNEGAQFEGDCKMPGDFCIEIAGVCSIGGTIGLYVGVSTTETNTDKVHDFGVWICCVPKKALVQPHLCLSSQVVVQSGEDDDDLVSGVGGLADYAGVVGSLA